MTKWAIRVRWLDREGKWHQRTSRWVDEPTDAFWDEVDEAIPGKGVEWLDRSAGLIHKEVKENGSQEKLHRHL